MSPETFDLGSASKARFQDAVVRFDQANAKDPNRELAEGRPQPKELVYARRMTEWLDPSRAGRI